jgi:two-component system CheB/CheR fusion protein
MTPPAPPTREAELEAENARLRQRVYDAELTAERAMALLRAADEQHRGLEKQLRRSRADLQSMNDTIHQLVWRSRDEGDWTSASPQWSAYSGQTEEQSLGLGWLDIVHPDDRQPSLAAWHVAPAEGTLQVDHRLRRVSDGAYRWFQTRATPMRDEAGRTLEWFGTSTDVHELRALQVRQRLLLAELQHQARNTLALVRVMAQGLARTSQSVDGYAGQLDDRLTAFSRVLGAVTRDPESGVDLESLVAEELVAQVAREDDQVDIAGPAVLLPSEIAETLGLAIYELASNAVEHGALTKPNGRVKVTWVCEANEAGTALVFEWSETNPFGRIAPPTQSGSGINFLEQTLVDRLKADVALTFAPPGLRCTIRMPLTDVAAEMQP